MIPAVPLPGWRPLLNLPAGSGDAGDPAPWTTGSDDQAFWLSRTAWSLAALGLAIAAAKGRPARVSLPEYICNQSLWPLRQTGACLDFHPVDDRLRPLLPGDPALPPDLVVVVHYFGWANAVPDTLGWCRRHGALLVEDCAHVLRPTGDIGTLGDAALYSPHKLLPCPDGAVLLARDPALAQELPAAVAGLGDGFPSPASWRLRKMVQRTPIASLRAWLRPPGQADFLSDPKTVALPRLPRPSAAGIRLIAAADLDRIARRRRDNAQALADAAAALAGAAPLFSLDQADAPYRLPLLCADPGQAEQLFQACRAERLPAESWPDLPPEIASGRARDMRRRLLLLPCHQDLRPAALAHAVTRALKRLG